MQSEDEATIVEGLELLKELLPDNAFAGRGRAGPTLFLTDDCRAERGALHAAFPEATRLLCTFHLLQAVWRWLKSKDHDISDNDRPVFYAVVKDMLYANAESALEQLYQDAIASTAVRHHSKFLPYLENLYKRRESWALSYRQSLPTRGNNTNNFVEAAMHVMKDIFFKRTVAFNLPQLFDLLTSNLELYYNAPLTSVALGQPTAVQPSRRRPDIKYFDVRQISDRCFEVRLTTAGISGKTYSVDMTSEVCSCPAGVTGAPCKHQAAVIKRYKHCLSTNFLPITTDERRALLNLTPGGATSLDLLLQPLVPVKDLNGEGCVPHLHPSNQHTTHGDHPYGFCDKENSQPDDSILHTSHQDTCTPHALHSPCPSQGEARSSTPADQPSAPPDKENMQPDRSVLIGHIRGVLTSFGNVINDPTTSDDQLATMTKRLEDILKNPFRSSMPKTALTAKRAK